MVRRVVIEMCGPWSSQYLVALLERINGNYFISRRV